MSADVPPSNADVARKVLRLMTDLSSDYRPRTYLLWHEYVIGRNAELRERLDKVVADRAKLSTGDVDTLFAEVFEARSRDLLSILHGGMQQLIDGVIASTRSVTQRAAQFESELEAFETAAGTVKTQEEVLGTIEALLVSAQATRAELNRANQQLEASELQSKRMADELRQSREEAHVDPLSGLANRRRFSSALADLIAAASSGGSPLTLLMIDIDRFKAINDKYGHPFGDQIIVGVSQAIKASVKGRDVSARFGGDEFSLILPDTAQAGAMVVAEYIRRIVRRARVVDFASNDLVTDLTLSVGVAALLPGETQEQLIRRADQALYRAKESGRDCVVAAE